MREDEHSDVGVVLQQLGLKDNRDVVPLERSVVDFSDWIGQKMIVFNKTALVQAYTSLEVMFFPAYKLIKVLRAWNPQRF